MARDFFSYSDRCTFSPRPSFRILNIYLEASQTQTQGSGIRLACANSYLFYLCKCVVEQASFSNSSFKSHFRHSHSLLPCITINLCCLQFFSFTQVQSFFLSLGQLRRFPTSYFLLFTCHFFAVNFF